MQATTRFVINNIEMLGFSNRNQDVIQSIIELIDNSIEACSRRFGNIEGGLIQVKIRYNEECRKDLINLDIIDNGTGFHHLEKMLQCFISGNDTPKIGKYGIGLTSTLINSCLKTNSISKITTKLPENTMIQISEIFLDNNGDLSVKFSSETQGLNIQSGTLISLTLLTPENLSLVIEGKYNNKL